MAVDALVAVATVLVVAIVALDMVPDMDRVLVITMTSQSVASLAMRPLKVDPVLCVAILMLALQ